MNGLANTVLIVEEESMSLNFRIFLGLSNEREKADGSKRSCTRDFRWPTRIAQQENTPADSSKRSPFSPTQPWRARHALPKQGRRGEITGGVPSGAHGATNKEHQVCARRRVVRRPGPC